MSGVWTALVGNAVIGALLLLVFRVWALTVVERYKNDLQSSSDQALERLRAELRGAQDAQIERLRAEVRIAEGRTWRFDERRFDALAEMYGATAAAIDAHERMARPMRLAGSPPFSDDWQLAIDAYNEMRETLLRPRTLSKTAYIASGSSSHSPRMGT